MKFKDFEIKPYFDYDDVFELVKWDGGKCIVLAIIIWNYVYNNFDYRSIGTRYYDYYASELGEWVIDALAALKHDLKCR